MTPHNFIYLHIPFCERKCPYCAFHSAQPAPGDEDRFLGALADEIAARSADTDIPKAEIETLYIGGGTPTALSAPAWGRLIGLLEDSFEFPGGADEASEANEAKTPEITVEANPNSLSPAHIGLWREWRVTRLSIGVQSTDDAELEFLGRPHSARQAADAAAAAKAAGFSVSLDLMFGLPGSTFRSWARTLRDAVSLSPGHISIYQLSAEPGTPFAEMGLKLPDGYAEYRYAQWFLPKKGYRQYEVASFGRPGQESRHNLNYWKDGDYIGFGPAAWGCRNGTRYGNAPSLGEYVRLTGERGSASVFEERLEGAAAARQAAVLALRTMDGIDTGIFSDRYGEGDADKIFRELCGFPPDLVRRDEKTIRLTAKGMRVANAIWSAII